MSPVLQKSSLHLQGGHLLVTWACGVFKSLHKLTPWRANCLAEWDRLKSLSSRRSVKVELTFMYYKSSYVTVHCHSSLLTDSK